MLSISWDWLRLLILPSAYTYICRGSSLIAASSRTMGILQPDILSRRLPCSKRSCSRTLFIPHPHLEVGRVLRWPLTLASCNPSAERLGNACSTLVTTRPLVTFHWDISCPLTVVKHCLEHLLCKGGCRPRRIGAWITQNGSIEMQSPCSWSVTPHYNPDVKVKCVTYPHP